MPRYCILCRKDGWENLGEKFSHKNTFSFSLHVSFGSPFSSPFSLANESIALKINLLSHGIHNNLCVFAFQTRK